LFSQPLRIKRNSSYQEKGLEEVLQRKAFLYDKSGEEHYNIISAFHKSLRGVILMLFFTGLGEC